MTPEKLKCTDQNILSLFSNKKVFWKLLRSEKVRGIVLSFRKITLLSGKDFRFRDIVLEILKLCFQILHSFIYKLIINRPHCTHTSEFCSSCLIHMPYCWSYYPYFSSLLPGYVHCSQIFEIIALFISEFT